MTEGTEQVLIGKQIGPYKVTALLGAGGMGEVYRAEDTRLGRTVAVKILPAELAQDNERLHRFVREARTASALNHANVAHIYEIGQSDGLHFIAMEYVEGHSLAERINGRPLDLKGVLDISIQTADALEEAHQKGITHRDIKSANVMLTPKGQVKVLDFGLAKFTRPDGEAVGSDVSTSIHTTQGRVMGTLHYMSPEQVLGKELDRRTDLFSLGVVLYEMTTGRLPFPGSQAGEVTDRILHGQPEAVARFNYEVPAELERIIRKCLEKDRERRYQSAQEVRADLSSLKEERSGIPVGTSPASSQSAAQRKKSWTWLVALGLGMIALVTAGLYFFRRQPVATELPSPPIPLTSYPGTELSPTFSPDGSQVAFSWNGERQDNFDIYVKLIEGVEYRRLTSDPASDMAPAWSPDGRRIAFVRDGTVFVISPLGGAETRVADLQAGHIEWTRDSRSLVVSAGEIGECRLLLLSLETRGTKELTAPSRNGFAFGDRTFAISPDGRRLAFARFRSISAADLYSLPLAGGEPSRLTQNEGYIQGVTWTSDGRDLVYDSDRFTSLQTLWRRSVDAPVDSPSKRVESAGPGGGEPVIQKAAPGSQDRLAYAVRIHDTNIWMRDMEESPQRARKVIASSQAEVNPQFSRDGRRIAFVSNRSGVNQIYVADRDGSNLLPLTSFSSGFTNAPRWSPDGKRIVFASVQSSNRDLYIVSPDGSSPRRLTSAPSEEGRPSWSRNGRWIYFYCDRTGRTEIWKIPAEGGEMVQLTRGGGHESFESPDEKVLYFEDYAVKGLQSVSTETSAAPKEGTVLLGSVRPGYWAVAEKGIYFVEFDDNGDQYRLGRWFPASSVSHPIKFYDFRTRQVTQIGAIEKDVSRSSGGFSVTWDGRYIAWSQIDHAESDIMMIENFR